MKKSIFFLAAALCLLWTAGCSQTYKTTYRTDPASPVGSRILERGELVVGMAGSMPPLNMTTKEGKVIGMEPDLAASMARGMGVRLTIKTMDFPKLLPSLEKGEVDMVISGMTITPKRNLKFAFVGPYYASGKSLLTRSDAFAQIENASALNNPKTRLAALENSTSQEYVETMIPMARLIKTKNYDEAVELVVNDEVDALIADFPICVVTVFRRPQENLIALLTPLTYEPFGIALSARDHLMVNWLENFLQTAKETGFLETLESKWLEDASWLKDLP